jgi:protein phosphatase-4 regulatory subunit 3
MPRIYVESEDEKGRCLLNTTIGKEEGYQKQQGATIFKYAFDARQWI